MGKAFLTFVLTAVVAALAFLAWPRLATRTCPVCQGTGSLEIDHPIKTEKAGQVVQRERVLCPFCNGGTLSLYDLRERRTQMLRWMVKDQKLPPDVLVKRVGDAFGQAGLQELHQSNFFMGQGGPE